MIDNNINAMPQAGLLEADLVYEIIVEGGETRMMAVLKGKDVEKIKKRDADEWWKNWRSICRRNRKSFLVRYM